MSKIIDSSKRFLKRNSSTILTCVGAIGVAATAVVSARDTIKAIEMVKKKEEADVKLSKKEIVKTVAPAYIPTIVVGLSTMVCIFGSNMLNKKTQACLTSAYALLDRSYKEYRDEAKKIYGEDSDERIKEGIAKNRYEDSDDFSRKDGKELFFDFYGLQFFNATINELQEAEMAVNQLLLMNGYVGLSTFYDMLGIECTDWDNAVGWSLASCRECGYDKIEFTHRKIKHEDGTEFWAVDMLCQPVEYYM